MAQEQKFELPPDTKIQVTLTYPEWQIILRSMSGNLDVQRMRLKISDSVSKSEKAEEFGVTMGVHDTLNDKVSRACIDFERLHEKPNPPKKRKPAASKTTTKG